MLEVHPAFLAEIFRDLGEAGRFGPARFDLAVEDAERIGLDLAPAVHAEGVPDERGRAAQGGGVRRPAGPAADRVDEGLRVPDAEPGEEGRGHLDDLRVDGRVLLVEDLDVDLVKLAVAALLGLVVAEHRPDEIEAERLGLRSSRCSTIARTTEGVYSGRRVIDRPPLSTKVYISFVTTSVVSPVPLLKSSVGSMTGARSSR